MFGRNILWIFYFHVLLNFYYKKEICIFSPLERKKVLEFYPVQKELMFDIDMDDYDEVRSCCSGVAICIRCWKYLVIAIKIFDASLRGNF